VNETHKFQIPLLIVFANNVVPFSIVRLGEYHRDSDEDFVEYGVDRGFRHMHYNNKIYTHDIGLLRLKKRVEYLRGSIELQNQRFY